MRMDLRNIRADALTAVMQDLALNVSAILVKVGGEGPLCGGSRRRRMR